MLATVGHMCQIGGTSPKLAESRKVPDYGMNITVGNVRESCKKAGTTLRKVARALRDLIIKIGQNHYIEGNLSKSYKLDNPNCDLQELVWVSDFQRFSDNAAIPTQVREWLLENYKKRVRPESRSSGIKKQVDSAS
jgi:hypothetical protein